MEGLRHEKSDVSVFLREDESASNGEYMGAIAVDAFYKAPYMGMGDRNKRDERFAINIGEQDDCTLAYFTIEEMTQLRDSISRTLEAMQCPNWGHTEEQDE